MRATYDESFPSDLKENDQALIEGEEAKHLIKVTRIKEGEGVLLLNGQGLNALSKVVNIEKKSLTVEIIQKNKEKNLPHIELFVGTPKKDAIEKILWTATSFGVKKLNFIQTKYSQKSDLNLKRVKSILINACKQSNNPYLLEVNFLCDFKEILKSKCDCTLVFLSTQDSDDRAGLKMGPSGSKYGVVIGPEGGLSRGELNGLKTLKGGHFIHFDAYILKTIDAVGAALGNLHAHIFNNLNL